MKTNTCFDGDHFVQIIVSEKEPFWLFLEWLLDKFTVIDQRREGLDSLIFTGFPAKGGKCAVMVTDRGKDGFISQRYELFILWFEEPPPLSPHNPLAITQWQAELEDVLF